MKKERNKIKLGKYFILLGSIIILIYILFCLISDASEKNKIDKIINNPDIEPVELNKPVVTQKIKEKYAAVLEIPKIGLKKGIYCYKSPLNNVDENITILKPFSTPSKDNSIFVLASHSGNSKVSYFKNLNKLLKGDLVIVYYNNTKYYYKIIDFYLEKKNGYISIPRLKEGKYIVLTTCKDSINQLIYIGKLSKEI